MTIIFSFLLIMLFMNYLSGQNLRRSNRNTRSSNIDFNMKFDPSSIVTSRRFRSSTFNPLVLISYDQEFQKGIDPNEELSKIFPK